MAGSQSVYRYLIFNGKFLRGQNWAILTQKKLTQKNWAEFLGRAPGGSEAE